MTAVGHLVDPVPAQREKAAAQDAPVRPVATRLTLPQSDGLPLLPAGIVGGGVLVIAAGLLRRRSRGRLSLPKV